MHSVDSTAPADWANKSQEFLIYRLLIVVKRGDSILAKDLAILSNTEPIPEIIGHRGIISLWILRDCWVIMKNRCCLLS